MLVSKQRLGLSIDVEVWIDMALQMKKVKLLPLLPEISILSTRLADDFHGDPADRLIVASGLFYKCPLVTKDNKIRNWDNIPVVW